MGGPLAHVSWLLALTLLFSEMTRAKEPGPSRLTYRCDAMGCSLAGVLVADDHKELRVLDLQTLQERKHSKAAIRILKNPASEQDVAALIGLAPLAVWFIAQSLSPAPPPGRVASLDGAIAHAAPIRQSKQD